MQTEKKPKPHVERVPQKKLGVRVWQADKSLQTEKLPQNVSDVLNRATQAFALPEKLPQKKRIGRSEHKCGIASFSCN